MLFDKLIELYRHSISFYLFSPTALAWINYIILVTYFTISSGVGIKGSSTTCSFCTLPYNQNGKPNIWTDGWMADRLWIAIDLIELGSSYPHHKAEFWYLHSALSLSFSLHLSLSWTLVWGGEESCSTRASHLESWKKIADEGSHLT